MTIDSFTNLYALFSPLFLYMEPPAPDALRGSVQNVESICVLLQTSSIIDEPPRQVPCCVFLHFLFLLASQHFCFNFLYIFVIALHSIMHFSLTACYNLYRLETRPLAKMPPRADDVSRGSNANVETSVVSFFHNTPLFLVFFHFLLFYASIYIYSLYFFQNMSQRIVPLIFSCSNQQTNLAPAAPKTYSRRQTRSTAAADAAALNAGQEQATTKRAGGGRVKKKLHTRKVPKQRSVRHLIKEQQAIRASYEEWLERQKEEA
jgi:hypothetical protein